MGDSKFKKKDPRVSPTGVDGLVSGVKPATGSTGGTKAVVPSATTVKKTSKSSGASSDNPLYTDSMGNVHLRPVSLSDLKGSTFQEKWDRSLTNRVTRDLSYNPDAVAARRAQYEAGGMKSADAERQAKLADWKERRRLQQERADTYYSLWKENNRKNREAGKEHRTVSVQKDPSSDPIQKSKEAAQLETDRKLMSAVEAQTGTKGPTVENAKAMSDWKNYTKPGEFGREKTPHERYQDLKKTNPAAENMPNATPALNGTLVGQYLGGKAVEYMENNKFVPSQPTPQANGPRASVTEAAASTANVPSVAGPGTLPIGTGESVGQGVKATTDFLNNARKNQTSVGMPGMMADLMGGNSSIYRSLGSDGRFHRFSI